MSAKLLADLKKALERSPGRHIDRSILRGDFVFVKGGAVGVNVDDGVGRRHFDDYLFGMFYYRNSVFMVNSDNMEKRQLLSTSRVK